LGDTWHGGSGTLSTAATSADSPKVKRIVRLALFAGAAVVMAAVTLVALGAGTGRFHTVPVDAHGTDVGLPGHGLAIVVPVSPQRLHDGDTIQTRLEGDRADAFYRVTAIDSWTKDIYAINRDDKLVKLTLGTQVGRVSRTVPYVGAPFRFVQGSVQGFALLLVAMFLVAKATATRRRRDPRWVAVRLAAVTAFAVGVMALTAGASFTATVTVNQDAISTGTMSLAVPAACVAAAGSCAADSANRLTLGASAIVPGDMIQRAVDLSVSGSTTSGIMTGATLAASVTASTQGAGGASYTLHNNTANSLRVWVQKCSTDWTESGTYSPVALDYTCSGSRSDVLGSSLPSNPPENVCAPSSGTVSSMYTLTTGAQALSNLTLTAGAVNHLLVYICLPTAADDNYQTASGTYQFSFAGTQRAGTNK
jgi:hypothetical protein